MGKANRGSFKSGVLNPNYGVKRSPEYLQRLYFARKDRYKPHTLETRRKMSLAQSGSKNVHWRGGIAPANKLFRKMIDYRLWRVAVFKKDDYRCMHCGERGVELHADHIYEFAKYPRLRLDINNGQTLCVPCHMKKHHLWPA